MGHPTGVPYFKVSGVASSDAPFDGYVIDTLVEGSWLCSVSVNRGGLKGEAVAPSCTMYP